MSNGTLSVMCYTSWRSLAANIPIMYPCASEAVPVYRVRGPRIHS